MICLILLNVIIMSDEHVGCQFNATSYNKIFLLFLALPETILRLMSLSMWNSNRCLLERKNILHCLGPIMYAGWLIYTIADYDEFTPVCYEPYPSFGLLTFCVIMVLILPSAFMVLCIGSFMILFCPCISYSVFNHI